jgi:hypothetical protein
MSASMIEINKNKNKRSLPIYYFIGQWNKILPWIHNIAIVFVNDNIKIEMFHFIIYVS